MLGVSYILLGGPGSHHKIFLYLQFNTKRSLKEKKMVPPIRPKNHLQEVIESNSTRKKKIPPFLLPIRVYYFYTIIRLDEGEEAKLSFVEKHLFLFSFLQNFAKGENID